MSDNTFHVRFFLDNKEYAARTWHGVPHAGDEVMLNFKGARAAFRVARVVWGNEEDNWYAGRGIPQRVNVAIEGPIKGE